MSAKAAMLQQEHSSMSGFHTPSSQPVSRVQSATSSDAFFDTSSHLSSQTASSYISAVNSAAVSSLNSFASSRPAVSTRQSTRDLIGALRQQAGLPHPDAFLSPPDDQEKTVVLPDTEQNVTGARSNAAPVAVAASQSVLQPVVLMQQLPVAAAAASGTSSTAVPVGGQVSAGLQTGPGGAIQEGQNVLLQPEPSGISGTSVRVSPSSAA